MVKPEYQKQGLGKIMMNDFCKRYDGFGRRILSTELDKKNTIINLVLLLMA